MRYSLLTNIATLGLVGRIKKAPGTAGSFLAVLCAPLCFLPFSLPIRLLILSVLFLIGIKASEQAEKELKEKDPSSVIIDEVVGLRSCRSMRFPISILKPSRLRIGLCL